MDYLERAKLINKVIEDGHEIIDRMRPISKLSELEKLKPIIDKYADFVDENFGEPSDVDDEKESSLTMSLYGARLEEKITLPREFKLRTHTNSSKRFHGWLYRRA